MRPISPGLYQEISDRMKEAERHTRGEAWEERRIGQSEIWNLTDIVLSPLCPSYELGKSNKVTVVVYGQRKDERQAWLDLRAFERATSFRDDEDVYLFAAEVREGFKFAGVEVGAGDKVSANAAGRDEA
jgi:hypothetical protein